MLNRNSTYSKACCDISAGVICTPRVPGNCAGHSATTCQNANVNPAPTTSTCQAG